MRVSGLVRRSAASRRLELSLPWRYRLMWMLGNQTGLRISDILALTPEKLSKSMTIIEQKTGNKREINISGDLLSMLRRFSGNSHVFESPRVPGQPLSRKTVWAVFKRAAIRAGIDVNVGTHSMRKSYALAKYKLTGKVEAVRADLGHKSIGATLHYLFNS